MQGQSETAKGLDAAQEAYDTVKGRASLTHESIDPTDNLQFEAELHGCRLRIRETGRREKSLPGRVSKSQRRCKESPG